MGKQGRKAKKPRKCVISGKVRVFGDMCNGCCPAEEGHGACFPVAMSGGERGSQDGPSRDTADFRCKQVMEMEGLAGWQPLGKQMEAQTEVAPAVGVTKQGRQGSVSVLGGAAII